MQELSRQIKNLLKEGNFSEIDFICKPIITRLNISNANVWIRSRFLDKDYKGCIELCIYFQNYFQNKNYIHLYLFHLRSLKKLNEIETAMDLANDLLINQIHDDEIYSFLIRQYYASSEFRKALIFCEKLNLIDPINHDCLKFSARISNKLNYNLSVRLEKWEQVLYQYPGDLESKVAISRILFEKGRIAESVQILNQVISTDKNYLPAVNAHQKITNKIKNKQLNISENRSRMTFRDLYQKKYFSEILSLSGKFPKILNLSNTELLYYFRALYSTDQYPLIKNNYMSICSERSIHINVLKCVIGASFDFKDFDYHAVLVKQYIDAHHSKDLKFGVSELIKSNIPDENILKWITYYLDHINEEIYISEIFSTLVSFDRYEIIIKIQEEYELNQKLYMQYFAYGQLKILNKNSLIHEMNKNPALYDVSDSSFNYFINFCIGCSDVTLAIDILGNSNVWGIKKNIVNLNLNNLLLHVSKDGDYAIFNDIIKQYNFLNCIITKKSFERCIILFLNNGGILKNLYDEIYVKLKNIVGGSSNLMSICYKCGLTEQGKFLWNFALLRFLTNPLDEFEFPVIVISMGRADLIFKLHEAMLNHPQILLNNHEFINYCEKIYNLMPGIFNDFSNNNDQDSNLIEISVLKILLNSFQSKSYSPIKNKIMHVSNSIRKGGAERQVINSLKISGFKKCLALYNPDRNNLYNSFIGEIQDLNVEIFDYSKGIDTLDNIDMIRLLECIPQSMSLNPHMKNKILALYQIFKSEKPEIVHLWQDATNIIGGVAAKLAGVPKVIMSARSTPPFTNNDASIPNKGEIYFLHQRFTRLMYMILIQDPNFTLCHNSMIGSSHYRKWLGKSISNNIKMPVVYNGFDLSSSIVTSKIDKNLFIVGGIFRFKEVKRPLLWIETALKLIKKMNNVTFVILGDGPMFDSCNEYIRASGHEDKFQLIGFTDDVNTWLAKFDVLLLTSLVEGLPNVLIEAQAMGIPVVSTNAGGAKETFINDVSGILLLDESPISIAHSIQKLLENEEWRMNAFITSRKWSFDKFHIDVMHQSLMEVYGV